ncbi:hypothetical protein BC937DRAFT_89866 [Endogone sp. FLAS-F59071]|nr:hypothetical protein BC937DRAFT_89866 [Endogone sp. FLAS-F59071]|eukprot:RUS22263.1 hypothetical protein BC937DRAFT_89866 [Endogone sp. FLAS-F59071]
MATTATPSYHYSSPRRNNPCNACRARKRKCDYVRPVCTRCAKTGKRCVYVQNLKPEDQKEGLFFVREDGEEASSPPEDVSEMRRRLQALKSEILALQRANILPRGTNRSSKSPPDSPASTSSEITVRRGAADDTSVFPIKLIESMFNSPDLLEELGWKINFAQSGIQIQTNVHNFQDLLDFVTTSLRTLVVSEPLHPLATVHENENSMTVAKTHVVSKFESKLIESMQRGFQTNSRDVVTITYSPIITSLSSLSIAKVFMDSILEVYFTEFYQHIPVIHCSVIPLLYDHSDPMSSPVLCVFAANVLRWCQDTKKFPTSLVNYIQTPSVCIYLFQQACNILNDSVLDEPSFNNFVALSLCNNWAMITMQVKKAWHFRSLAFRMAPVLVQARYQAMARFSSPPSSSQHQYYAAPFPPVPRAEWETFKRIFWINVPIELTLREFRVGATVAHHVLTSLRTELGIPMPLDDERGLTRRTIYAISAILRCFEIPLPSAYDGDAARDSVPIREIAEAERALRSWYNGIPADLRMVTYDQLQLEDLAGLATADVGHLNLYISLQYHGTMMRIHEQFFPILNEDASAFPISPAAQYSHDICTRCARVVTTVFENLSRGFTNHFFMVTLLKACDVHYRNTYSTDPVIRERAKRDLEVTLGLSKKTREGAPQHKFAETVSGGVDHTMQELGLPKKIVEITEPRE